MTPLAHSLVIATYERPAEMRAALESIAASSRRPETIVVVDASRDDAVRRVVESFSEQLPILFREARIASAAQQRNQGAEDVATPLVVFMDDDAVLRGDTLEKLCAPFDSDAAGAIGGVAGRIDDMQHPPPRGLLRCYYRFQSGFAHRDYGGKLFSPGINCLPCYGPEDPGLIAADWLNSTLVVYRTEVFRREKFPAFEGYSSMEDVHLSARVARTHKLFFHRDAPYTHTNAGSDFKRNHQALARSRMRHQRALARDVLGLHGPEFEFKFLLHRVFVTLSILRGRGPGRLQEFLGTWT